jgi:hypothetical protein
LFLSGNIRKSRQAIKKKVPVREFTFTNKRRRRKYSRSGLYWTLSRVPVESACSKTPIAGRIAELAMEHRPLA